MPDVSGRTVVLGLGNPIMGDDGLGLAALDALRARWSPEPGVELVDGGTWGLALLPVIEGARRLLLLDAIECGAPPGTVVRLESGQIPAYFMTKLSPHQVDMREVLALAALRGQAPSEVVAIGAQPGSIELADTMTPEVAQAVETVSARALEQLRAWASDSC